MERVFKFFKAAPWNGRNLLDLLKNIRANAFEFPPDKKVNKDIENLLIGCLQIEEEDRFTWDQIYRHPTFKG